MKDIPREPHTQPDTTSPAPGDLELVRAFLSVHDHVYGTRKSLPPGPGTIAWWLRERGLVEPGEAPTDDDLRWAAEVLEALRSRVEENMGAGRDDDAIRTLDAAAREAGLSVHFGTDGLRPSTGGVRGAVGRILA